MKEISNAYRAKHGYHAVVINRARVAANDAAAEIDPGQHDCAVGDKLACATDAAPGEAYRTGNLDIGGAIQVSAIGHYQ